MLGTEAAGDGTFGPDHPRSICEALCEVEQNDTIDAAAIVEAVLRPTMRFVQVNMLPWSFSEETAVLSICNFVAPLTSSAIFSA